MRLEANASGFTVEGQHGGVRDSGSGAVDFVCRSSGFATRMRGSDFAAPFLLAQRLLCASNRLVVVNATSR
jgi:hypothetical protein